MKLLKIILIFILIIIGIATAILLVASLPPGERYLKGLVEKQLTGILSAKIEIGSLETDLFSNTSLENVIIYEDSNLGAKAALRISRISVNYDLWHLPFREISIRSIELDSVEVNLGRDSSGFNLALLDTLIRKDTTKNSEGSSGWTIEIGKFSISELSAAYAEPDKPLTANIAGASLEGEGLDTPGEYRFSLKVDTAYCYVDSLYLESSHLISEGQLLKDKVALDTISGTIQGLAFSARGDLFYSDSTAIAATLTFWGDPAHIINTLNRANGRLPLSVGDEMALKVDLTGGFDNPRAAASLEIPELTVSDINVNNVRLDARLSRDTLLIDTLSLSVMNGSAFASGRVVIDSLLHSSLSLQFKDVELKKILAQATQKASISGQLDGGFSFSGPLMDMPQWSINGLIDSRRTRYNEKSVSDFKIVLSMENNRAHFEFDQVGLTALADAKIGREEIDGAYEVTISDMAIARAIIAEEEISGEVNASGRFVGQYDDPTISMAIVGRSLVYRNFPIDSLSAIVDYSGGNVSISSSYFSGRIDSIEASRAPFGLDSLSGSLDYSGTVLGSPDNLHGRFDLIAQNIGYGKDTLDWAEVHAAIKGRIIELELSRFRKDSLLFQVLGNYSLATSKGALGANIIDLASWEPMRGYEAGQLNLALDLENHERIAIRAKGKDINLAAIKRLLPKPPDIGGLVTFEGDFSGTVENPDADLKIAVERPTYFGVSRDSLSARLSLKGNELELDTLRLFSKEEGVFLAAKADLKRDTLGGYFLVGDSRVKGRAKIDNLDMTILKPFLPEGMETFGEMSLAISWDGTVDNPRPQGEFDLKRNMYILYDGADTIKVDELTGRIADSSLVIRGALGFVRDKPFTLDIGVITPDFKKYRTDLYLSFPDSTIIAAKGVVSPAVYDLHARIILPDLSIIESFVSGIDSLSGKMRADIRLAGSPADPILMGTAEIDSLTLRAEYFENFFSGGIVRVSFEEGGVVLDTFFTHVDKGRVIAYGSLSHQGGKIESANFRFIAGDLRLTSKDMFILGVDSANIHYYTSSGESLADGIVNMAESRLLYNFDFQSLLPWAKSVEQVSPAIPVALQNTRLDIRINGNDKLWLDNNLAKLRLSADLSVMGNPAAPKFTGRISAQEGYLIYLDRRFDVQSGTVFFVDPTRFNPEINLTAQTTVRDYGGLQTTTYNITLNVSGQLEELDIQLTSTPPLGQPDIIALLTLGATRQQLTGGSGEKEGGLGNVLAERAQVLSSGRIAGYISGKIGNLLGLEKVSVEGNLFRLSDTGPRLTATKQISKRVEITYAGTVGEFDKNSVSLEYDLTKRFSLVGQTNQEGKSSLNLKYGLKFR